MKNILFIAALLGGFVAKGQMTLEHIYHTVESFRVVTLEGEGEKYVMYDTVAKNIKLYNIDHSIWKTIPLSILSNGELWTIAVVSTKFFNTDSKVEAFIGVDTSITSLGFIGYIINEDGSILQTLPGIYNVHPVKVGSSWKAQAYDYNNMSDQPIYSVPGSLPGTGLKVSELKTSGVNLYPNPIDQVATLRYTLPEGVQTGKLYVYDATGHEVRSYEVSNQFHDILLHRNDLAPGIYTYKLAADGTIPAVSKFVIR